MAVWAIPMPFGRDCRAMATILWGPQALLPPDPVLRAGTAMDRKAARVRAAGIPGTIPGIGTELATDPIPRSRVRILRIRPAAAAIDVPRLGARAPRQLDRHRSSPKRCVEWRWAKKNPAIAGRITTEEVRERKSEKYALSLGIRSCRASVGRFAFRSSIQSVAGIRWTSGDTRSARRAHEKGVSFSRVAQKTCAQLALLGRHCAETGRLGPFSAVAGTQ
jgi:hypothetical protein